MRTKEIPQELIKRYLEVASNNKSPEDGRHIETLAYLMGHRQENGTIVATELIFPAQKGSSIQVDDEGKFIYEF